MSCGDRITLLNKNTDSYVLKNAFKDSNNQTDKRKSKRSLESDECKESSPKYRRLSTYATCPEEDLFNLILNWDFESIMDIKYSSEPFIEFVHTKIPLKIFECEEHYTR